MGMAKARMMELEELGISDGWGGNVCGKCLNDYALSEFVKQNRSSQECDYCNRKSTRKFATYVGDVAEFMAKSINQEWTDPANELPYESREGGYIGHVYDGHELLYEVGFDPLNSELFEHIASFFCAHPWCKDDYYASTPSQRQKFGWTGFCYEIMHRRRFTFWSVLEDGTPEFHPDYLPAGKMLSELGDFVNDMHLIKSVPVGARFWRAQNHKTTDLLKIPDRFTSPPIKFATQANRMSPAGIPMFYGAEDLKTAMAEVVGDGLDQACDVSGVAFESKREMHILDLVVKNKRVSYFDENGPDALQKLSFLRYFAKEVSKPIARDGKHHIEYVPTQAFTEYVRFELSSLTDKKIDGIRYQSSITKNPCVVLFLEQADCLDGISENGPSLQFVPGSLTKRSLKPSVKIIEGNKCTKWVLP